MPRSGTTLVEQILASHPEVFGAGELTDMQDLLRQLTETSATSLPYPECLTLIDGTVVARLADDYLARLRELSPDAPRVTDKLPSNFWHLGIIAVLFPHARIIHCMRDPMDVCLSCYFQDFDGYQPFAYDLTDLGQYYTQYERVMAHWREVLPVPILDVRYEELIADTEYVARGMIAYCDLNWDEACLAFHETDRPVLTSSQWQVRLPAYTSSIGRWKHYDLHLGPLKRAVRETASGIPSASQRPAAMAAERRVTAPTTIGV